MARDPLGLLLTVVAAGLAVVLAAGPVVGGVAVWGHSAALASAPLSRATVGHAFVATSTGTGGATFSSGSALNLVGGAAVVDLTSTSSVPVVLAGTVKLSNFLLGTRVTIKGCSVAWQAATCAGTTWTVLDDFTVTGEKPVQWSPTPVPTSGVLRLRLVVSGSLANSVTLTALPAPARAPGDRTAG